MFFWWWNGVQTAILLIGSNSFTNCGPDTTVLKMLPIKFNIHFSSVDSSPHSILHIIKPWVRIPSAFP